jgi:hypothetical protein
MGHKFSSNPAEKHHKPKGSLSRFGISNTNRIFPINNVYSKAFAELQNNSMAQDQEEMDKFFS